MLYDREMESEWKQFSGVCIAGDLEGETLAHLPAAVTTWGKFREAHPETGARAHGHLMGRCDRRGRRRSSPRTTPVKRLFTFI